MTQNLLFGRYDHRHDRMVVNNKGMYVHWFDFRKLQAKNKKLQAEVKELKATIQELRDHF